MSPASEIAIRSDDAHGIQRERDGRRAAADRALEPLGAARAAKEIDPLVHARIADGQQRPEHLVLQRRDIETIDRRARIRMRR